jgi:hypothetical protein
LLCTIERARLHFRQVPSCNVVGMIYVQKLRRMAHRRMLAGRGIMGEITILPATRKTLHVWLASCVVAGGVV